VLVDGVQGKITADPVFQADDQFRVLGLAEGSFQAKFFAKASSKNRLALRAICSISCSTDEMPASTQTYISSSTKVCRNPVGLSCEKFEWLMLAGWAGLLRSRNV